MYYNKVLMEENTSVHFQRFNSADGAQKLVARMLDDRPCMEWELQTLEDMRWKDNRQHPLKYCSRIIFQSIRRLMWQHAALGPPVYPQQHFL
jgi:hypothetical protein